MFKKVNIYYIAVLFLVGSNLLQNINEHQSPANSTLTISTYILFLLAIIIFGINKYKYKVKFEMSILEWYMCISTNSIAIVLVNSNSDLRIIFPGIATIIFSIFSYLIELNSGKKMLKPLFISKYLFYAYALFIVDAVIRPYIYFALIFDSICHIVICFLKYEKPKKEA